MASNLELECPPDVNITYGPEFDSHTHIPRTANLQYSALTEEQEKNIKKNPAAFFMITGTSGGGNPNIGGVQRERYYKDRYVHCDGGNLSIGKKITRDDASADMPGVGERSLKHFDCEDKNMYMMVDSYCRPPTNMPGPIMMRNGRPTDHYYCQRDPSGRKSGGGAAALASLEPRTLAEYEAEDALNVKKMTARLGGYPELSEYQDRFERHQ